jgi:hypothetical protein
MPDFLSGRALAPPQVPSETEPTSSRPGFQLTPRSAPQATAPLSTDGRAGTQGDPVLQAVEAEGPDDNIERAESERQATSVVSDEPLLTVEERVSRERRRVGKRRRQSAA